METYEFVIIVSSEDDWKTAVVQIGHDDDIPFPGWMVACEYLIHTVARMSNLPYDEARRALKRGANTYEDVAPS